MGKLVDCKSREWAHDETFLNDANACAERARQKMIAAMRLTAGVFVAAGHHELGTAALEKVRACVELKCQKELKAVWKRDEVEEKLWQKVLAVHEKEEVCWTAGDVQVMVSWFKRPGDSKMPSTKELLKEQYEQTKSRHEDNRAYLKPGEAAIIDAIDEQNGGGEGEGAAN